MEPRPRGLSLVHEQDRSLRLSHDDQELLRYVYRPWDAQLESPRPYFHPLRTLSGATVSLYRPHDHVWHKGIAWSLPNVGPANFWGGPTYLRDGGYQQLDNNGSTDHLEFEEVTVTPERATVTELLEWVTQQGETWFSERRSFTATVSPDSWTLVFETSFTNRTDTTIRFGSPTTEGRPNAGYGGLFWRGPRSFTNGRARNEHREGGDDLMGERSPWLAFTGQHDGSDHTSTLVFVDCPTNPGHPTRWFVRNGMYACVSPAPFFDEEVDAAPGQTLAYRYAVVIADGDPDPKPLADVGLRDLTRGRQGD
nr:PmoA family protein [Nocardiopsis ganjiahuensis]